MYEQNQPSLLSLLGTVVVFVVAAGYGIISMSTEDPLWFVTSFTEQASEASVACRGEMTTFAADSPHLTALNDLVMEALSGPKNWDSLTMSEETRDYYSTSDAVIVVIMHYSQPVRVHSIYKYFSGVDTIVIPLLGRHSRVNAVFAMIDNVPTAGALHIETTEPILSYLDANGICSP